MAAFYSLERCFCSSVRPWKAAASFSSVALNLSHTTVKNLGPKRPLLMQMTRSLAPVHTVQLVHVAANSRSVRCPCSWDSLGLRSVPQVKSNRRQLMFTRREVHSTPKQSQFNPSDSEDNRFEKENILTVPNLISLSRIVLSPVLGYLVLSEKYAMAFGLFACAGFSDLVDGYIARRFPSQSSMLGTVLDPLADKCLVSVLCVSLTAMGLIPLPLTAVILSRDALLISGSFYLRFITMPPPRTWVRYWDIQRSVFQVMPTLLGKINTLLQLSLVGLSLGAPVVEMTGHPILQALWYITGFTTVVSGLSYTVQLRGFRILKKKGQATSHSSKPS